MGNSKLPYGTGTVVLRSFVTAAADASAIWRSIQDSSSQAL